VMVGVLREDGRSANATPSGEKTCLPVRADA
jgi:hypothetical protein